MSTSLVPQSFGAVSTRFANLPAADDLGAGVQGGFGHVGYKGKVWSIRHRGETINLMRPDGDGPMNSIEVVIIKAAGNLSKNYYPNGYTEGTNERPYCFSSNGQTPDPSVPAAQRQASVCAQCKWDAFGSKPLRTDGTPSGKGKACTDAKRLAVVPLSDIDNEFFGGPLLLRVPAGSLQDLASYGGKMNAAGYPYYAVGTRIAFDPNDPFPKFVFSGIRALSDEEADKILALRDDPRVARILAEASDFAIAGPAPAAQVFEQASTPTPTPAPATPAAPPPQPVAPAPAPQPAPAQVAKPARVVTGFGGVAAPAAAPAAVAAPVAAVAPVSPPAEVNSAFEAQLDAQLEALLPAA